MTLPVLAEYMFIISTKCSGLSLQPWWSVQQIIGLWRHASKSATSTTAQWATFSQKQLGLRQLQLLSSFSVNLQIISWMNWVFCLEKGVKQAIGSLSAKSSNVLFCLQQIPTVLRQQPANVWQFPLEKQLKWLNDYYTFLALHRTVITLRKAWRLSHRLLFFCFFLQNVRVSIAAWVYTTPHCCHHHHHNHQCMARVGKDIFEGCSRLRMRLQHLLHHDCFWDADSGTEGL